VGAAEPAEPGWAETDGEVAPGEVATLRAEVAALRGEIAELRKMVEELTEGRGSG
jgi:uncharacterized protein involved in exopolysaccharide biosynthesis